MKNKLIGLYGASSSGKSTVAKLIQHKIPSFDILAYGDIVKKIAEILYHIPFDKWQDRSFKAKYRSLLEVLGINLKNIHPGIIIEALTTDLRGNNIIGDVRTLDEARDIHYRNGKLILIRRDVVEPDNIIEDVPLGMFDYVIYNDGSIDELENKVNEMIAIFGYKY